jgi:uncharacterized radical SAM superfamily Fe-S cluster-containing enzyme
MDEVLAQVEKTTNGFLRRGDFVPSPCAHPLCYQIAYLLVDSEGGKPVPFTRFLSRSEMYFALADRLYLEPTAQLEQVLRTAMDRLWSEDSVESSRTLRILKKLTQDLYPTGGGVDHQSQLRIGEQAIKAIYIHSHMDEETFDVERVAECCDSNCYADGTGIPVCNYNVLYRDKEAKFNEKPAVWGKRSGGVKNVELIRQTIATVQTSSSGESK